MLIHNVSSLLIHDTEHERHLEETMTVQNVESETQMGKILSDSARYDLFLMRWSHIFQFLWMKVEGNLSSIWLWVLTIDKLKIKGVCFVLFLFCIIVFLSFIFSLKKWFVTEWYFFYSSESVFNWWAYRYAKKKCACIHVRPWHLVNNFKSCITLRRYKFCAFLRLFSKWKHNLISQWSQTTSLKFL